MDLDGDGYVLFSYDQFMNVVISIAMSSWEYSQRQNKDCIKLIIILYTNKMNR